MTSRTPSDQPAGRFAGSDPAGADPAGAGPAGADPAAAAARMRGWQSSAYVLATVLGGVGGLVLMVAELVSGDGSLLDVLLWAALSVLLFGAALHHWWFGGRAEHRSRRIVAELGAADISAAVHAASGEIDAVRRLRQAHPGLGLRDAYEIVRRHPGDPRLTLTASSADVVSAVRGSTGEVDAVRRLRHARPGLSLREAYELVRGHVRESG